MKLQPPEIAVFITDGGIINRQQGLYMNKLFIALAIISGSSFAQYNEVNIVPASTYLNNSNFKDKTDAYFANKVKEFLKMNKEQSENGFISIQEPRAKELQEIQQITKYRARYSAQDTDVKHSISDIPMGYSFVGVPANEVSTVIGYAPYGAYKSIKNGEEANGWDGAVEFFHHNTLGNCAYTEHNRRLANADVELIEELVTYDVAEKPTLVLVKGNDDSGYLYKIDWFDALFNRTLECESKQFSQQFKSDVIHLANQIESAQ